MVIGRKYNEKKIAELLSTVWQLDNKMIVILDDKDIDQMLIEKIHDGEPEKIVKQKIEDFRLSI